MSAVKNAYRVASVSTLGPDHVSVVKPQPRTVLGFVPPRERAISLSFSFSISFT